MTGAEVYYKEYFSTAEEIANKQRWQIEIFFKWIKQNLKIRSFLGTSENAVMTQIYVALIHYLLVADIKFLHGFTLSLMELTNRIRDILMQNLSRFEILARNRKTITKPPIWNSPEQLELFNEFLC